jgi:ABC-type dipeptide/oligopeptide/nickel transport system permease component
MSETLRWLLVIALVVTGVAIRWFPLGALADVPSFPSALTGIVLPGCLLAVALLLAFVRRKR